MLPALLAESQASFWMPKQGSTVAPSIDGLFNFVLWINIFFFVLIMVMMLYFAVKYRHRPGVKTDTHGGHSTALELTWTIIPTILVLIIFYWGFKDFMDMAVDPPNAYEITATGQMWQWTFTYPNGVVHNELHVPKDKPVRIIMQSQDVIHSLYIPVLRAKKDVVPGRYNKMWFTATELSGDEGFDIYCAEYCGQQHSVMRGKCVVQEPAEFQKWLDKEANPDLPPIEMGKRIYQRRGCTSCHSVDGSRIVGPTFKDAYGASVPLADGSTVPFDEVYLRESVEYPQAKIHAGFPNPSPMPPFKFKEVEMKGLAAYLQSISSNYKGPPPDASPASQPAPVSSK